MDELKELRKLAKEKHDKYINEKNAEETAIASVKALEDSEKAAKELKFNDENESIGSFLLELDTSINDLINSNDIFLILQIIQSKIESIIKLIKEHDRLSEIQDRILIFIEILNKSHQDKKNNTKYVSQVSKIVKYIFELCEVDVEIEEMDTSNDDNFALKLQEQMYNLNINNSPWNSTGGGSGYGGGYGNGNIDVNIDN